MKAPARRSDVAKESLVVVGGGLVERRGSHYYVKAAVGEYLRTLADRCHRVHFITRVHHGALFSTKLAVEAGIEVHTVDSSSLGLVRALTTVLRVSRRRDCLIFLPNTLHLLLFPWIRLFARRVAVYTAGDWRQGRRWGTERAMHWALRRADLVLARGHTSRLARHFNDRVYQSQPILAYGSEQSLEKDGTGSGPMERDGRTNLLVVSNLRRLKALDCVLEAVDLMRRRSRVEVPRLHIVGDGEDRDRLEDMVDLLSLQDLVEFHGYVDDPEKLSSFYSAADVFVFHSLHEGEPRVLEEAAGHGLAIVAVDLPGIRQRWSDVAGVCLYQPKDRDTLCSLLERLVSNPGLRAELGEQARAAFASHWDFPTAAEQHLSLLMGSDD